MSKSARKLKRMAILVACSPEREKPIRGVYEDVKRFSGFLRSPYGGCWIPDEVQTLIDPGADELEASLAEAEKADFGLVTFSGHGEQRKDGPWVCIDDGDIHVKELHPRTPRSLIIVDSCRTLVRRKMTKIAESRAVNPPPRPSYCIACRVAYEQCIQDAEEGTTVMYSCSPDQSAGEDPSIGGYFTHCLTSLATDWAIQHSDGRTPKECLPVADAFELARRETYDMNYPQTAVLQEGRRRVSFPFAVA